MVSILAASDHVVISQNCLQFCLYTTFLFKDGDLAGPLCFAVGEQRSMVCLGQLNGLRFVNIVVVVVFNLSKLFNREPFTSNVFKYV